MRFSSHLSKPISMPELTEFECPVLQNIAGFPYGERPFQRTRTGIHHKKNRKAALPGSSDSKVLGDEIRSPNTFSKRPKSRQKVIDFSWEKIPLDAVTERRLFAMLPARRSEIGGGGA
ncbi:hypothetical protein CEXT_233071 [Caerostris extrusa]|uniref:Uncharacterized protein n=1 Tax=Caerostris extrusa TaxID=172846 RepID=A0AAV4XNV3_CAEEX|nr:hypothetical protein CEXT_233071 [Caerostris extrusa]